MLRPLSILDTSARFTPIRSPSCCCVNPIFFRVCLMASPMRYSSTPARTCASKASLSGVPTSPMYLTSISLCVLISIFFSCCIIVVSNTFCMFNLLLWRFSGLFIKSVRCHYNRRPCFVPKRKQSVLVALIFGPELPYPLFAQFLENPGIYDSHTHQG